MNIDLLIQEEIKATSFEEVFREQLKKQIEETTKRVLKDVVGPYSDFAKKLKEHVEKNVGINFDRFTLPQYSNFVVEQTHVVVGELMNEERAARVRAKIAEKLSPNIQPEIEFDELFDALYNTILSYYDDSDCCDDKKFKLICEPTKSYIARDYDRNNSQIIVMEDGSELAALYIFDDGRCYHSRGQRQDEIARRFASYDHLGTLIKNIEHRTVEIDRSDTY